jgi:hypothetical protein
MSPVVDTVMVKKVKYDKEHQWSVKRSWQATEEFPGVLELFTKLQWKKLTETVRTSNLQGPVLQV